MDIQFFQQEKALVQIIFARDTLIEQLGVELVKKEKENKDLRTEIEKITGGKGTKK